MSSINDLNKNNNTSSMTNLKDEILDLSKNFIDFNYLEIEKDDNFMGFGPTILFKKILSEKYKFTRNIDEEKMKDIYKEYENIFDNYEDYKDIRCINCLSYIVYINIQEDIKKWNWWVKTTSTMKLYLYNLNKSCLFLDEKKIENWINRLYIHKSFLSSFNEIELYLIEKEEKIQSEIEKLNNRLNDVNNLLPDSESYKKNTSSPTTNRLTYNDFYFLTCTKHLLHDEAFLSYETESDNIKIKFRLNELEHLKQKVSKLLNVSENVSEISSVGDEFSSSSFVSDINLTNIDDISTEIKKSIEEIQKNMDEIDGIKKDLYTIKTLFNFLLTSNYCELFFINFDEKILNFFNYKQLRIIRFHPFYDRTIKYSICRDIDGYISDYDWSKIYEFTNGENYDTIFYSLDIFNFFKIDKTNNNVSSHKNSNDENYLNRFKVFLNNNLKKIVKIVKIEENKDAVYFYGEYALWQNTFQKCLCSMRGTPFPNKYDENSILSLVELENKESYFINNLNYCPFPMIACLFGTKFKLKQDFVISTINYLKEEMTKINESIENFYWFKEVQDDKFINGKFVNKGKTHVKTSMQTGFDEILLLLLFQFKGMKVDVDILNYKESIERNIVVIDNKYSTVNGKSSVDNKEFYNFLNKLTSNKFRLNVFDNIVLANLYKLKESIRFKKEYNQIKQIDKKLLKNQSDLNNEEKKELKTSKFLLKMVEENIQSLKKTLYENQRISSSTTSSSITENVPNEYQGLRTFLDLPFGDTDYYNLQEVQSLISKMIKKK